MHASAHSSFTVIFSSGAAQDNEMHRLRTLGILDTLQEIYGVTFDQSSEELAVTEETTALEAGDLKLLICPGYLEREENCGTAEEVASSGEYTTVLSVVPVSPLIDTLESLDIECGVIDCFSEDNYYGFKNGTIAMWPANTSRKSVPASQLCTMPLPAMERTIGKTAGLFA